LSVVPKKLVEGLVPELPVVFHACADVYIEANKDSDNNLVFIVMNVLIIYV
jgi:hypothetical protein